MTVLGLLILWILQTVLVFVTSVLVAIFAQPFASRQWHDRTAEVIFCTAFVFVGGLLSGFVGSYVLARWNKSCLWVWVIPTIWVIRGIAVSASSMGLPYAIKRHFSAGGADEGFSFFFQMIPFVGSLAYSLAAGRLRAWHVGEE